MEFFNKTLDPVIALAVIAVADIFLFPSKPGQKPGQIYLIVKNRDRFI